MELKLTLSDWLSHNMTDIIPLHIMPIKEDDEDDIKQHREKMNSQKELIKKFLKELKEKRSEIIKACKDSLDIGERYIDWKSDETLYTFPEEASDLKRIALNNLEKYEHRSIYLNLMKHNNIVSYYDLINKMTTNISSKRGVYIPINFKDEPFLVIFKNAIMMCPPSEVQSTFEYISEQLLEAYKIDSKEEMKKKRDEISADFHKSLRQVDPLGNPHSEMIIYSLIELSEVPFKIIESIVQETNNVDIF